MIERICPKCNVPINGDKCTKPAKKVILYYKRNQKLEKRRVHNRPVAYFLSYNPSLLLKSEFFSTSAMLPLAFHVMLPLAFSVPVILPSAALRSLA